MAHDEPIVYSDAPFEPEPWIHGGERAITERCACGAPGNVRYEDGSVACFVHHNEHPREVTR